MRLCTSKPCAVRPVFTATRKPLEQSSVKTWLMVLSASRRAKPLSFPPGVPTYIALVTVPFVPDVVLPIVVEPLAGVPLAVYTALARSTEFVTLGTTAPPDEATLQFG